MRKERSLSVDFCGVPMKNPVTTCSGTFGSGLEYADLVPLTLLGAVTTKGVASVAWEGNPVPRVAETPSGMLNAIGLQNPGVEVFVERDLPFLRAQDTRIIVNVCGHTLPELMAVVERLSEEPGVDLLEINVSCPNVREGGMAFGTTASGVEEVTAALRRLTKKPLILKLTPNVTSVGEIARAAEAAGADAVSLINTLLGMKIDVHRRRTVLANGTGGLSGPAIHPVAVRMVHEVHRAVRLPILGMGGVASWEDAAELILAGATMVGVGTALFRSPAVIREIVEGLASYMEEQGVSKITELIGALEGDV